jgi:hypothetical protein
MVAAVVTNFVPVFYTNVVQVPVTNLVAKPEALAAIEADGLCRQHVRCLALAASWRWRWGAVSRVPTGPQSQGERGAVQGVETARAVLTTTPQGQAADAQFVKWLMDHQKEAGVFTTVSGLVEQLSDNPAAKMTAQEIAQRVQQAQQQRTARGRGGRPNPLLRAVYGVVSGLAGCAWKSTATTLGFSMPWGFFLPLLLPVVERRHGDLGVFRVGVVHGFGVVPQGLLSEALREAALQAPVQPTHSGS